MNRGWLFFSPGIPPIAIHRATGKRGRSHTPSFRTYSLLQIENGPSGFAYAYKVLEPAELIDLAKKNNVEIMSINDHDTVRGVMNMLSLECSGITVLCGIECSSRWNNVSMHITGYFPRDTDFQEVQKKLQETVANPRYIVLSLPLSLESREERRSSRI